VLNSSIQYRANELFCDSLSVSQIAKHCGTPVYIYSLRRALENLHHIQAAFNEIQAHIHYSAKANGNLAVLRALIQAGAGVDAVSAGEIHRALLAGASPEQIVFAGVGKTPDELRYGVEQGIGWFNIENVEECRLLNDIAATLKKPSVRVALRLNPEVTANTHPYIATGHGQAKFGLTAEVIHHLLNNQADYPHVRFEGIHLHIGSQLHDTGATLDALEAALDVIAPFPFIKTVNIGGGLPVAYQPGESMPAVEDFAATLSTLLKDYDVLLEPGRSIIADAGILVARVLYVKRQAGQTFLIMDASMTELIRPALYQAHHEIVPVVSNDSERFPVNVVGPVCETTDVLGREVMLPEMLPGDLLAVLTTGAYGMVMASNYNARPRPPEVVVSEDGEHWNIARKRETWDDMLRCETAP
jgi:diaminopimelate decarboxylase